MKRRWHNTIIMWNTYLYIICKFIQKAVLTGQVSSWANVAAGVPLFFSIYINDLLELMIFADDTSLFSVIHDSNTSKTKLNVDLPVTENLAFQSGP